MKKTIFIILGVVMLSLLSSCEVSDIRGTQVPKNVIEVEGIGKIGQMTKFYDFSEKFIPCWDYGFSENEDFGRWCMGEKGFMIFHVRKNASVTLRLDMVAFLYGDHKENRIRAVASGVDCGEIILTGDQTVFLNLDSRHISSNNAVELELFPLNAKSPQELGMNEDARKIGFGLSSVTLWAYYPVEEE